MSPSPLAALIAVKVLGLRWMAHWGATGEELAATLPGDELVPQPDLTTTRAATINARAADLWPWNAQLGQDRGGFYSYDTLENLVGCDVHSADHIGPAWQSVAAGAQVRLAPEIAMTVALTQPGHALVLRGGIPIGCGDGPTRTRPGRHAKTQFVVPAVPVVHSVAALAWKAISYPPPASMPMLEPVPPSVPSFQFVVPAFPVVHTVPAFAWNATT